MIEPQPEREPHYTMEYALETRDLYRLVEKAVNELTEKEQMVMNHRFFDEETLKEIGERLGVGRERIRQIEAKALRKIRHRMWKWLKTKEEREEENQELCRDQQRSDQETAKWRLRQSSDPKPTLRLVAEAPIERPAGPGREVMDGLMKDWYGSLWQDHVNSSAKCLAATGLKDVRGKMGRRSPKGLKEFLPECPSDLKEFQPELLTESLHARLQWSDPEPKPDPKKRRMLTYEEVAAMTSLPVGTLYSMVHRKELPHYRLSPKTVRFSENDIRKWIEDGYVPAKKPT